MLLPQQWEGVAQERMLSWEKEMKYRQLLAELPQEPPRWRRWTGGGMVWVGRWLLRWGERMVQCECTEGVTESISVAS